MRETKDIKPVKQSRSSGRPSLSPEQRATMKKRIATEADRLFRMEGYGRISVRRIAKEIGCAPMTIYKYYDAKIDILRTLWSGVFEDVFEMLEQIPRNPSPQIFLSDLGVSYVQYWLEHPEQYRLVFMAEGVSQPDVSIFLDNPQLIQKYNIFTDAISRAGPSESSPEDSKSKIDFFLSTLHGITHNYVTITGYPWSSPEEQIGFAVRAISKAN